ncbi:hypothetical protein PR048_021235 [Dryococelus australis]|uniref:Uncharacterized protein n=1 Tax=Dryococelus australis TaxID=614101 RepID=A0ABQ9GXR8_9NEOP|nr:hypothetical protein PR048_021235 [Dryococelus australis]
MVARYIIAATRHDTNNGPVLTMELEEAVMLRLRRRRKKRRFWVHPILKDQSIKSIVYTLYSVLRENTDKFFMFMLMSTTSFE